MQLIKNIDPDFISNLNKQSSIIIGIPEDFRNNIIEIDNCDIFGLLLSNDINLSHAGSIVSSSIISVNYKVKMKLSIPIGVRLNIEEPISGKLHNMFLKIYNTYDVVTYCYDNNIPSRFIYENIELLLYVDMVRLKNKELSILPKNEMIATMYFNWYLQTKVNFPLIDQIYIIRDDHVYENFINII